MSLPDTVFIFVLALIIFGPKKLPEIGRQIGKLVGEFRRASNEFKYQIEEELRNADILDKPDKQPTIAAAANTTTDTSSAPPEAASDPTANLPVGQHPNIDTLNTAELNSARMVEANSTEPAATPIVTPAEGAEARTTVPHVAAPVPQPPENVALSSETHASDNGHAVAAEAEITHG